MLEERVKTIGEYLVRNAADIAKYDVGGGAACLIIDLGDADDKGVEGSVTVREKPVVMYTCDRRACENCPGDCAHTTNVEHASHFVASGGYFVEAFEGLSPNEYQVQALYYERGMDDTYPRLFNGLMGLNGEAGEAIDLVKKATFQGHKLDKVHLAKELGDVLWYVSLSADAIGWTLENVMKANLKKLAARYPSGFDSEKSRHRVEGDV